VREQKGSRELTASDILDTLIAYGVETRFTF